MAKPNKTSSEEFLVKRRQAIADKAKRLREQQDVVGSGVSVGDEKKNSPPLSLRGSQAASSQR